MERHILKEAVQSMAKSVGEKVEIVLKELELIRQECGIAFVITKMVAILQLDQNHLSRYLVLSYLQLF